MEPAALISFLATTYDATDAFSEELRQKLISEDKESIDVFIPRITEEIAWLA